MDTCAKDQSAPADACNPDIAGRIGRDQRHFLLRANLNFRSCFFHALTLGTGVPGTHFRLDVTNFFLNRRALSFVRSLVSGSSRNEEKTDQSIVIVRI